MTNGVSVDVTLAVFIVVVVAVSGARVVTMAVAIAVTRAKARAVLAVVSLWVTVGLAVAVLKTKVGALGVGCVLVCGAGAGTGTVITIHKVVKLSNPIIGTTRKTDEQITQFNGNFKMKHQKYHVFSTSGISCQSFVEHLFEFLLQEGDRCGNLPVPQIPGQLWAKWVRRVQPTG